MACHPSATPSRPLFGFSHKPPREVKTTNFDRGHEEFMELGHMLAIKARPPPISTILKAFREFFATKDATRAPLEEIQAQQALVAFKHIQENNEHDDSLGLTDEDLQTALRALTRRRPGPTVEKHTELAELLFEELVKRRGGDATISDTPNFEKKVFLPYIRILTRSGHSLKGRKLVEEYWKAEPKKYNHSVWHQILRGFAAESNDEEILRTIELMRALDSPFNAEAHQTLVFRFVQKEDLTSAKRWYSHPIDGAEPPTARININILKLCILQKDFDWGQSIFTKIVSQHPDKEAWDAIFQWAAAKGKGVDEIERMMTVMIETNKKEGHDARPDTYTINGLIGLANTFNDPYKAERYVALANKLRIPLDAQTYLLQMEYRIKIGDLGGARRVYGELQGQEAAGNKDVPLINNLILALCNSEDVDTEAIMGLVEDLTERKARFEPTTVSALCLLHLRRNELHDVIDLLQTHAFHYELDQRASIRDTFVEYCLDRANSTTTAWDAYTIFREIFDETRRDVRTKLMVEFFERRRSDMATHVFGHMRQSAIPQRRPIAETYALCLEGIGKQADLTSLEIVHNMLKLDSEVEPNTRLNNALMIAYSSCGEPERSLEFWDDIVYSREGPTYDSICIALQACQITPFGETKAREIWQRLQRFEIEVTKEIYTAYVASLAGRGLIGEATDLLGQMETEVGSEPDAVM